MPYYQYTDTKVAYVTNDPSPAKVTISSTVAGQLSGYHLWLEVNGDGDPIIEEIPASSTPAEIISYLSGYTNITTELVDDYALVKTVAVGTNATLHLRAGSYSTPDAVYALQSAEGDADDGVITDTRTYAWTWVAKEVGFSFESAPSPPSDLVDVFDGQVIDLSGLEGLPTTGCTPTHRRIYRSVNGVYLFVAEIAAAETTYSDTTPAEELGEALQTASWLPPPSNLAGLTNLPNGIMAGFVGRDVYFCDPYHPHAWPVEYIQTVDYPIVGLAALDTTLVVLTTGVPYFMQGAHPENMVVVKSELEQACLSKRSIVPIGGAVYYAAPDGLVALAPSGSRIVTQALFDKSQWLVAFSPDSIHAYAHDNQYVAFYDNGTTQAGFVYDTLGGEFSMHGIYAVAGFSDLRTDTLYLAYADNTVKRWAGGSTYLTYTWRSKKFTMPEFTNFSCGKVDANAYPVTMKVYSDGTLILTKSVTSRDPFRLPTKSGGHDWEIQLEGTSAIYEAALATSFEELSRV